jgi:Tol biopolymer transport system component
MAQRKSLSHRLALSLVVALSLALCLSAAAFGQKGSDKKEEKKKEGEPFSVKRLTHGMGLSSLGPVSPNGKLMALIAAKPDKAPNLYLMDLADFSIRPAITSLAWGVSDPRWSPDSMSMAFAGNNETGSFSELYVIDVKTAKLRAMTSNSFSDKEPVFTPDGKRLLYTTDESPLPDAAFGILHIASVAVTGGNPSYFTEDETSSIQPGLAPDGKSVLLVKINEDSGRHSLWQYGFDGKPQRDLTERKFARIHSYVPVAQSDSVILWAQEEAEQRDGIYMLDLKSREVRETSDPALPKRHPAISPNGQLIAFIAPAESGAQLFLLDLGTGQIRQLTSKGASTFSPVFITNDQILFGSDRDKSNEIYSISLAQTEEKKK